MESRRPQPPRERACILDTKLDFDFFIAAHVRIHSSRHFAYENVGSFTKSSFGTPSRGKPAFRQAANPPWITNALKPCSLSRSATRALVASRAQVQ
jgi:hypothetical protein